MIIRLGVILFGIVLSLHVTFLCNGHGQTTLDSGLVAHWHLNGNARDTTGNGHDGIPVGVTPIQDRFGNNNGAYHFDGSSYIMVGDDSAWAFGRRPFTVSLWAKFSQASSQYVIGQSDGGGNTRKWIFWSGGTTLLLHMNSPQTGGRTLVQNPWTPDTNWHHLAVSRLGNVYSLFVDSTLLASATSIDSIPNSSAFLLIGNAESTNRMFRGRLDDVRIYNRALSLSEIKLLVPVNLLPNVYPSNYVLSQNYPNPFNPETKIEFQVASSEFVELKIFDLLGREVATLVNEWMNPGTYSASWDASGFASGVYLCRMRAGKFQETRKFVLLK